MLTGCVKESVINIIQKYLYHATEVLVKGVCKEIVEQAKSLTKPDIIMAFADF